MAYIDLKELMAELGITETTENRLLETAIEDAQSYIESQTNRRFEANTETHYFDRSALSIEDSYVLDLDDDLISVTTLLNGDSSGTTIVPANYWTTPRNRAPPYHHLQIKKNSGVYWEWDIDCWVSVTGTWGYTAYPPADIRRACIALAAYFYRKKDAQAFDVTAVVESGALIIPQGIPATVTRILERYRKYI